jgi:outer membrane lipoprotein carrier protein
MKSFVALSLGLLSLAAQAKEIPLPKLLQEVEARYAKVPTVQADFAQIDYISALDREKKSSGVFLAKKPDKVRWETTAPDVNLLVSDGHKFWFYTPPFDETEHGQVIEKRAAQIRSKLAQALLSGRFSAMKGSVKTEAPNKFLLVPTRGSAGDVDKAEVEVDPKEKLITQVTLFHSDGNRSQIALTKIELGTKIADQLFYFIPPPGTIQVKE